MPTPAEVKDDAEAILHYIDKNDGKARFLNLSIDMKAGGKSDCQIVNAIADLKASNRVRFTDDLCVIRLR